MSIKEQATSAKKVLEVGCGEGSKLVFVAASGSRGFGVDISQTAITEAQKQYPRFHFQVADARRLPFADEQFDLVFSAFTLEHLQNPEQVIQEMVRVLKPKGIVALLAPNYGAPNRVSPCFHGSRIKKLVSGLAKDGQRLVVPVAKLGWQQVTPKAKPGRYEIDWDTTVEPYLGSLVGYLKQFDIKLTKVTSFWGIERTLPWWQQPLGALGKLRLYPFGFWGPHLFVMGTKNLARRKSRRRRILMVLLLIIAFLLPLTVPLLLLGAGAWVSKRFLTKR